MPDEERQPPELSGQPAGGGSGTRPPTVTSQELLRGNRELWIDHEGEIYRLRITSRGKLYLTK